MMLAVAAAFFSGISPLRAASRRIPAAVSATQISPVGTAQPAARCKYRIAARRGSMVLQAKADKPPPPPRIGSDAITPFAIASMVQARATAAGFDGPHFGSHSLKRGALTTGMERGVHPADLKRLGRHKSFDVLGGYLQFRDLFDRHALKGVL
jgi:hypothetical protein